MAMPKKYLLEQQKQRCSASEILTTCLVTSIQALLQARLRPLLRFIMSQCDRGYTVGSCLLGTLDQPRSISMAELTYMILSLSKLHH